MKLRNLEKSKKGSSVCRSKMFLSTMLLGGRDFKLELLSNRFNRSDSLQSCTVLISLGAARRDLSSFTIPYLHSFLPEKHLYSVWDSLGVNIDDIRTLGISSTSIEPIFVKHPTTSSKGFNFTLPKHKNLRDWWWWNVCNKMFHRV